MPAIAYFVHGRGRGHASRSLPVVRRLRTRGHRVTIFGGGDGALLLRGLMGWRPRTAILPGVGSSARIPQRVAADIRDLRALEPQIVVSDGDMPSLLAARALALPTISVGHGLVFTRSVLPPDLPRVALAYECANNLVDTWVADRTVAVHFLPTTSRSPTARLARPDVAPEMNGEPRDDGFVLCYFRDGNGAGYVRRALERGLRVVCFGDQDDLPDGAEVRPFDRAGFVDHLLRASGVMASAGSNVLAECVHLGKPLLALHRADDHEQHLNAVLAERAGVALGGRLDASPAEVVDPWIDRLRSGGFRRVDLAGSMPQCSEAVVEAIEELLP